MLKKEIQDSQKTYRLEFKVSFGLTKACKTLLKEEVLERLLKDINPELLTKAESLGKEHWASSSEWNLTEVE